MRIIQLNLINITIILHGVLGNTLWFMDAPYQDIEKSWQPIEFNLVKNHRMAVDGIAFCLAQTKNSKK